MAHLDPRTNHRRAKTRTISNLSTRGKGHRNLAQTKQRIRRKYRRRANQPLDSLRDFRCVFSAECECAACNYELYGIFDNSNRYYTREWACTGFHDKITPLHRFARSSVTRSESFEDWLSQLKRIFPDSFSGRHALEHILGDIDTWVDLVGCTCRIRQTFWAGHPAFMNHRPCRCGNPWKLN